MTFETKDDGKANYMALDDGYCSSECSNMSECSMDSMESIISGIEALVGKISHKIDENSLITIFGHKHFRQKFHQKFNIFM